MKLDSKIILITGASSGFGKAVALRMAKDNCTLILTARNTERLKQLELDIQAINPNVKTKVITADLSDIKNITKLFNEVKTYTKHLDVVFDNAGLGHVDDLIKIPDDQIKETIDINVTGMILVAKYAAEMMTGQRFGHIIMTSSLAGLITLPQWSVYVASKWAITGFAASLEMELAPHNVRVSTIHPGPVETEFFKRADLAMPKTMGVIPVEAVSELVYKIALRKSGQFPIPYTSKIFGTMYRLFPRLTKLLIKKVA
jgi:short-subunit dehydrogenase